MAKYIHNLECDWCEGTVKMGKRYWSIEFTEDDGEKATGIYHESCALNNNIGYRDFERVLYKEVNG